MTLERAKQLAYSTHETLMFTHECAIKYANTNGDYVECGVAAGAQIIAMSLGAPNKTIHAFDSFEGIPLPSNKDDQMPGIKMLSDEEIAELPDPGKQTLISSGATSVSVEDFLNNVTNKNVIIHKGWFEETVPNNTIGTISILRLDGDLYNSTLVCLRGLFHKVIDGGTVIIDDWQLPGCRLACREFFKEIDYKPNYIAVSNIMYFVK